MELSTKMFSSKRKSIKNIFIFLLIELMIKAKENEALL